MNYRILCSSFIFSCIAAGAVHAGVAEKKARRAAEDNVAIAMADMQSVCGNTKLSVQFDWDAFDSLISAEAAKIEKRGDQNAWVIDKAADRTVHVVKSLADICEADADYKEEIAKISNISVTPKPSYDDYETVFTLDGTTLVAETGHIMNRSPSDFESRLLELF